MTLALRSASLFGLCLACTTTISVFQPDPPPSSSAAPAFGGAAVQAPTAPPAVVGGSVRIVKSQNKAFAIVSDQDEDAVDVIELGASPTLVGKVQLQPGDLPNRIVADAGGLAHVVLRGGGAIATIDPVSASLVMRRDVCPAPRGIDYDPSTDNLYVACATGELVTLASRGAISRTVRVDRDLRDVVVSRVNNTSQIFVTRFRSAERLLLDANGAVVTRDVPPVPSSITASNNMSPDVAWRTISPPGGGTFMLHQLASNDPLVIVPAQTYYAEGGLISVPAATIDGAQSVEMAIEQGIDVAFDDQNNSEVLSFTGSVQIGLGSTYTNNIVALTTAIQSPYDPSYGTYQFIGIDDGAPIGVPYKVVQRRAPTAELEIYASSFTSTPVSVTLPQNVSHLDTGFDLFHVPTIVGTACMNCHPEGADDSHSWKFSDATSTSVATTDPTIRRTQSLRNVENTAPYHWDGSLHDMQAVCDEVFTHRMGGGKVTAQQAAILTHWIVAVPRIPVRTDLDQTSVSLGKAVFASAGCEGCHVGGTGVVNTNQDIGKTDSIGQSAPLQVPSLFDVADRAPYMHDGCAASLMDRLTNPQCAGANHGNTASLSDADRTNLETYLESL